MLDGVAAAHHAFDVSDDREHPLVDANPDDLTVQIRLRGSLDWHRPKIGGRRTACDEPADERWDDLDPEVRWANYHINAKRHESYEGPLCRKGCFSPCELADETPPKGTP